MNTRQIGRLAAGMLVAVSTLGVRIQAPVLAAPAAVSALQVERVNMVIVSGLRLGIDKKLHDAFTPTNIAARTGQKVVVTVYNYDMGNHSFTSSALHLNVVFPASKRTGVPSVTTFSFTATKAGSYNWKCVMPCDDTAKGWAMSHMNYMAGTVTVTAS